jgi:hypothetical protein
MLEVFEVDMNASQLYRNLVTGLEVEQGEQRIESQSTEDAPLRNLVLGEWIDSNELYLGLYCGYTGRYQVDWDAEVVCGNIYALGKKVATFGGNSVTKAKLDFQKSADNYIARCQIKAQVEEDLLGVVHD